MRTKKLMLYVDSFDGSVCNYQKRSFGGSIGDADQEWDTIKRAVSFQPREKSCAVSLKSLLYMLALEGMPDI